MTNKMSRMAMVVIGGGLMALTIGAPNAMAKPAPKPIKVKGTFVGSFVNVPYSFDGAAEASLLTFQGKDNLGGPFVGQNVAEYVDAGQTCNTLPGGASGELYNLVEGISAQTYSGNLSQVVAFNNSGSACLDTTTGLEVGQVNSVITGGSGNFANASGTTTSNFVTQILDVPAAPGYGVFGVAQGVNSGSVTK